MSAQESASKTCRYHHILKTLELLWLGSIMTNAENVTVSYFNLKVSKKKSKIDLMSVDKMKPKAEPVLPLKVEIASKRETTNKLLAAQYVSAIC